MTNDAIDRLREPDFDGEEFIKYNLLGLTYFMREDNLLQTAWYDEDCSPDSSLYNAEGYIYWKQLSCLSSQERKHYIPMGTQIQGLLFTPLIYFTFISNQLDIFLYR